MNNIPPQYKKLAESAELYDQSEKVGNKFGLLIDQIGELDAEIRGVLLGIFKPSDFTKHLTERLEIDSEKAASITQEVNKEIFETLKKNLQTEIPSNSSLETAGGFTIEQDKGEAGGNVTPLKTTDTAPIEHRDAILKGIEDPKPTAQPTWSKEYDRHTEPLVDHLLSKPTYIPEEKITHTIPATPEVSKPVEVPKKLPTGPDMYREPIE